MKSYVVVWVDWCGRVLTKSYKYRKCCETFATKLCWEGIAYGQIKVLTFAQGKRVKSEVSRKEVK